jgi:hypothetical protein
MDINSRFRTINDGSSFSQNENKSMRTQENINLKTIQEKEEKEEMNKVSKY